MKTSQKSLDQHATLVSTAIDLARQLDDITARLDAAKEELRAAAMDTISPEAKSTTLLGNDGDSCRVTFVSSYTALDTDDPVFVSMGAELADRLAPVVTPIKIRRGVDFAEFLAACQKAGVPTARYFEEKTPVRQPVKTCFEEARELCRTADPSVADAVSQLVDRTLASAKVYLKGAK